MLIFYAFFTVKGLLAKRYLDLLDRRGA